MSSVYESTQDLEYILRRFPKDAFSSRIQYRAHAPSTSTYDVILDIPFGSKKYIWYTFWDKQHGVFWLDVDLKHRITRAVFHPMRNALPTPWYYGTIVYGTLWNPTTWIVEEMMYFQGVSLRTSPLAYQMRCWNDWITCSRGQLETVSGILSLRVVTFSATSESRSPPYRIHHRQYRSFTRHEPYVGIKETTSSVGVDSKYRVFDVRADIAEDLYYLSEIHGGGVPHLAYIPNIEVSRTMNRLFRHIRETENIDWIEESDDEEDLEDTRPDKYVDLGKRLRMECEYWPKFKRWVPRRVV